MLRNFLEKKHASRGLTLVEMLLVMAIFGIVMLAVMSLFIPAVKSTAVQTQVTDVQSNLRLALNRMSQDLLTAGFLIGTEDAIIFESGTDRDAGDFTIQTRAVGNGFARILSATSSVLTLSQPDMVNNFPVGSKVRLFDSISSEELEGVVYTINAQGGDTLGITPSAGTDIPTESVVIKIKNDAQPALQTIRYRLQDTDGDGNEDALVRIVNGDTQFLARNVNTVNFDYNPATGSINQINVRISGETAAVGTDAISSAKQRELQTTVTLRNVY